MKRIFYLLLVLSFIFLFVFLLKQDIIIPKLPDAVWLIPSLVLLFTGFYASTQSWRLALRSHGVKISHSRAIESHGLSVFAKYIPGKIWVILGRASYIAASKSDIKNYSFISLKEQLIYTWLGFVISTVPTLIFYGFNWLPVAMILLIVLLTLFLFFKKVHDLGLLIFHRIFKLNIEIPFINFRRSMPIILSTGLIWISWTLSFYFFIRIFTPMPEPVFAFSFPLSVCFGLLAIIFPGGLGVREGIIVGYLVLAGMETESATTIAFFNRFAFIAGETFIFLLGAAIKIILRKRENS